MQRIAIAEANLPADGERIRHFREAVDWWHTPRLANRETSMRTIRKIAIAGAVSASIVFGAQAQSPAVTTAPQTPAAPAAYSPTPGQAGKDVVWVPTPQALVDRMLDMAGVTKDDTVIDLGSGDGRTVITAARRGARAVGIEYNPDMVVLARRNAQAEGIADRATFEQGDIFQSDFSKASVITLFLLPDLNIRLRPILLGMKPGTRVVSNTFEMGDWQPDDSIDAGSDCTSYCRAFKWVIPAKVGGVWRVGDGELKLTQTYQMLDGVLVRGGKSQPISNARMNGAEIVFTAGGRRYTGRAGDGAMAGSIEGGGAWSATRSAS